MGNWIVKAGDATRASWNIVKSAGPFLIAQSKRGTDAYVELRAKLAGVEAAKELMVDEGRILNEVRKDLLQKYTEAERSERLRVKQDLEYIARCIRKLSIRVKALSYLPEAEKVKGAEERVDEVSGHWMDKFDELVRVRNEEWREELLAKALATEAAKPGSVSTRLLWLIGTLEEQLFERYATVLDICSRVGEYWVIPGEHLLDRVIPECVVGPNIALGRLVYMLDDVGLLADYTKVRLTFHGRKFVARYMGETYQVICKGEKVEVGGITPSRIGGELAQFYEQKYMRLGKEIFEEWIKGLNKDKVEVVKLGTEESRR